MNDTFEGRTGVPAVNAWLKETAFPFWTERGFDSARGAFHEALDATGKSAGLPPRAMVQARQIYSFRVAERFGDVDPATARDFVGRATDSLIRDFSLPSGGFAHTIALDGTVTNAGTELYTQAFALFALAQAWDLLRDERYRARARELVAFLRRDQANPDGGYREIKGGKDLFQSNPHMHLFEAALAWANFDREEPLWRELADEIAALLENKFIDRATGALTEHFSADWSPVREGGRFFFEPGHHFEWTWLLGIYQRLNGTRRFDGVRAKLYDLATRYGVRADRRAAIDEVWSDFETKRSSSRFWPQTERIKAAVQLADETRATDPASSTRYAREADEAVSTLFEFIGRPLPALWMDTWNEDGGFVGDPVKASSLYHIVGALYEYVRLR